MLAWILSNLLTFLHICRATGIEKRLVKWAKNFLNRQWAGACFAWCNEFYWIGGCGSPSGGHERKPTSKYFMGKFYWGSVSER